MAISTFSIRGRFIAVVALVTASFLLLAGLGLATAAKTNAAVAQLFDQIEGRSAQVADLRESLSNLRRWEASLIAVGTSNAVELERQTGL